MPRIIRVPAYAKRFCRVNFAISFSFANRCKHSRAHHQHDRSSTATSNPPMFSNATNRGFAVPQNPSSPRARSPPIIHSLLPHGRLPSPKAFYQVLRKDVLIFTTTHQNQLEHPHRLNNTSNLHLRHGVLDNRSRRRAEEYGFGREDMGIHGGSGYDTGIRGRILHVGCQDQRRECGNSRMGIVGARGQRAADYQLGICESLASQERQLQRYTAS